MSGSWISDRPEAEEHPVVPIGFNEMAVPRIAILASIGTAFLLLVSSIWIGLGTWSFLNQFDDSVDFTSSAVSQEDIQVDGRWTWEATLLFYDCESRTDDWSWPSNLASQDDVFWLPGELRCIWQHQGQGDYAHLAIHNVDDNNSLPLSIKVTHSAISMDGEGQGILLDVAAGDAVVVPLRLEADMEDGTVFTVTLEHVSFPSAVVSLDVEVETNGERDRHARSEHLDVDYYVSDADTGDYIDDGTLGAYAGEDPRCDSPVPWVCYIEGFGWGLVGLDVDTVDPTFDSGTTHTILLPPDLAYGNSQGHEYQDTWMLFELTLNRLLPA